jgi:tetratricopeptide (TPR) repeat protein
LLDAARHLEAAWSLDPTAVAVGRALIGVYLALGRFEDALALTKKVVDLAPDDHETWYSYARQLREQGKTKEALDAMTKAAACPSLKEIPLSTAQITFDLGIYYEESLQPTLALVAFQKASKTFRDHGETLIGSGLIGPQQLSFELARVSEKIARLSLKQAQYQQAIQAFETTQAIAREDLQDNMRAAQLGFDLAKVHHMAGNNAKSLSILDEYLKTQPADLEPYQFRIALLREMQREGEIIPSLKTFVELDRHNLDLRLLLADEYSKEPDNLTRAQEEYEKVIQESANIQAFQGLFRLLKNNGSIEEILNQLDKSLAAANSQNQSTPSSSEAARAQAMLNAIRQDPELIKQLIPQGVSIGLRGNRLNSLTREYLAVLAARTNQLDAAESFYRSCLKESPSLPGSLPHEQEVFEGLLRVLNLQGKYEEIIKTCRVGLRNSQATNRMLFHQYLAQTLSRLGKTDEALSEVDQMIQLADEKNRSFCRLLHIHVLSEGNQHKKAIEECQDLLKVLVNPDEIHDLRMSLYNVYTAAHENAKAEDQIRRVLQDYPNDATAHNNLGYMLADQGKSLPEAENLVRRALELDRRQRQKEPRVGPEEEQDTAAFVDSLGWVLFRLGRFQDALHELQRATSLQDGNDPVIWDHLGDVFLRLDQVAKAKESWSRAVSLYEKEKRRKPDDQYKDLKHKLELLQNP